MSIRPVETVTMAAIRDQVASRVVGREAESELLLAAIATGRDIVLEGPPGTSKTTLLRAITAAWGVPLVLVEGNADLTPSKLLGHHHPAQVLRDGYSPDNFVDGPLLQAMRSGGFLYLEELNRAPDDTLNTLLTAMADREVNVPRLGRVEASSTFRVVASMNPFDNVGTTRLSTSIHDRMCRLAVGYQDEEAELEIVARRTSTGPAIGAEDAPHQPVRRDAVALTRATRRHPSIRQGSSVRGAIDLALIASELLALRGVNASADRRDDYTATMWDAVVMALSGRIHVDEVVGEAPEAVLREIWEDHFLLGDGAAPG